MWIFVKKWKGCTWKSHHTPSYWAFLYLVILLLWWKLIFFDDHRRHYRIIEKNNHLDGSERQMYLETSPFLRDGRHNIFFCFQWRISPDRLGMDGNFVKLVVSKFLTTSPIRERDFSVEVLLQNLRSDLAIYATGYEGLEVWE